MDRGLGMWPNHVCESTDFHGPGYPVQKIAVPGASCTHGVTRSSCSRSADYRATLSGTAEIPSSAKSHVNKRPVRRMQESETKPKGEGLGTKI